MYECMKDLENKIAYMDLLADKKRKERKSISGSN